MISKVTDKALCAYLQKYHRGQECAASSKELEAAFHVKGTELRRAINRLRCGTHPICSDASGYFYAARQSEIRATVAQLTGRISKMDAAAKGLMKAYKKRMNEPVCGAVLITRIKMAAKRCAHVGTDQTRTDGRMALSVSLYVDKSVRQISPNADLYGKALPYIPKPKIGEDGKGLAEPAKSQLLRAYPKENEPQTTERVSAPLLIAC